MISSAPLHSNPHTDSSYFNVSAACKNLLFILNTWDPDRKADATRAADGLFRAMQSLEFLEPSSEGCQLKETEIDLKHTIDALLSGKDAYAAKAARITVKLLNDLAKQTNNEHHRRWRTPTASCSQIGGNIIAKRYSTETFEQHTGQMDISNAISVLSRDINELRRLIVHTNQKHPETVNAAVCLRKECSSQPPDASTPNVRTTVSPNALQGQLTELQELRRSIAVLKQLFKETQHRTTQTITHISAQVRLMQNRQTSTLNPARTALLLEKEKMARESTAINSRLDQLKQIVETLRVDVTRRMRPSQSRLRAAWKEALAIQESVNKFTEYIGQVRPTWKKTWEDELQGIVREQAFLKAQEGLAMNMEESHSDLLDMLQTVARFLELSDSTGPSAPDPYNVPLDVMSADEVQEVGLSQVLEQIRLAASDDDSERRLQALENLQKIKLWEKNAEKAEGNDFEDELVQMVRTGALKKTGGVEEVERIRAQKDAANIRANFR
ncbi:uncharacterized protein SPPG_02679 [Spizellomyces punctatus DAOM BR117]|uniref:Actin interacting protein 3 C-terminal domain-containing protein n=1 Tax=Spizellomyces punctatus (strain DAOM BR117) TaxID=645134 RepID=A0A0L0HM74_SPIPD|nr:uncharacterized protein SPPG_02679 [Spizellomyces punctatus DAOM BR117]KND02192.1 hypothetical protein SPPG_02679 [Spizellomyces punctatus DAOM BR117]|eukprot:XP_016610231.1 hypothetical protein SPPG_02679 [Spizellomyces punctatus DAOM BR117]